MNNLKEARLKAGLTQQAMSDLLEIPKKSISNWETGQRKCPIYLEKLIIEKLNSLSK